MPRGDGTGPMGMWTNCNGRPRMMRGGGFARGFAMNRGSSFTMTLEEKKALLQKELDAVTQQIMVSKDTGKKEG